MLRNFGVFDTIVANDTHPVITHTFLDDGQPLDISLPTTDIEVKMLKPDTNIPKVMTLVGKTGSPGEIFWKFESGDNNIAGIYKFQLRAIFNGDNYTAIEQKSLRVKSEIGT